MKNFKKIISMLLMLSLALCLCLSFVSCTAPEGDGEGTGGAGDGKVQYTVTVKDVDGTPLPNFKVQLYLDGIVEVGKAVFTDGEGKAVFNVKEGNYSAKIVSVPGTSNYVMPSEKFPLSDNQATIVIKELSTYTVYVKDTNGAPVAGASVQLCDSNGCKLPAATNEEGMVIFYYEESDYKAALTSSPDDKHEFVDFVVTITVPAE